MSNNTFQILSNHSLQKLRRAILANPEIIELDLDSLAIDLSLTMVSSEYKINLEKRLVMPVGFKQDENFDTANCVLIHEILPGLTPAHATDERLWTTLCFGIMSEYVKARWPFRRSEDDKLSGHVLRHWFPEGVRGRMRDNAVSRLWWMGYIASKVPNMSPDIVHELLFSNSDYRSSLLERNSSANSVSVLVAILRVSQTAFANGTAYSRVPFREFMKRVDFLGGRRNLAAMDEESLVTLFSPEYQSAYGQSK